MGIIAVGSLVAVYSGIIQDYQYHADNWRATLDGEDPWVTTDGALTSNPYGPLFPLLALPFAIHPLLPKLLYVVTWAALAGWLFSATRGVQRGWLVCVLILNPFFWIEVAYFGHFDILMAAASILAIHLARNGLPVLAGGLLAGGALLKFIPLALAPYLGVRNGHIQWRYILSLSLIVLAVFVAAWATWGNSVLAPLSFAVVRPSKHLSIFRFLEGAFVLQGRLTLRFLSLPLMLIAELVFLGLFIRKSTERLPAMIGSIVLFLSFYQVGNQQFYILPLLLIAYWVVFERGELPVTTGDVFWASIFIAWISLYDVGYVVFDNYYTGTWRYVRDLAGLPTLLIAIMLARQMIKFRSTPTE